eukprot:11081309-Karenia_brevis.AAC.1
MAWWQGWQTPQSLHRAVRIAQQKAISSNGETVWAKVAGPVATAVATANRIGWSFIDGATIQCDNGAELDLRLDPPCVVQRAIHRAVS